MRGERVIGGGVLALGLLAFFILIPLGVDNPADVSHLSLAPDFWPRIISGVFALMGLLMLVHPGPARLPDKNTGEDAAPTATTGPERLLRLAMVLAVLFGFYCLIPFLGMVAPGIVVIWVLMRFAGERRLRLMAVIATATPLLLYFFFTRVAGIPVPLGVFEFLRG